ncbi:HIT family protein [Patescibacteria group bacterium]
MADCVFCKIVAGEIPTQVIYEDSNFVGFLDLGQIVDGHTLLVPKNHYRWIWNVPNIAEMYQAANKIVAGMKKVTSNDSVVSMTIGEMVHHAHMHLLPSGAEGVLDEVIEKWDWGLKQRNISKDKMQEIAEIYRTEIGGV